jgi:chromosome segregation ATPase
MRQPEAENRKEMIISAVTNFSSYVDAALSNIKSEEVLEDFEIKSEIIKEFFKTDDVDEKDTFDPEVFKQEFEETLKTEFEKMINEKINLVKTELSEIKDNLNTSLNEQFELYTKKEDMEKKLNTVKTELEDLKNTTKKRNSEIDENVTKIKKTEKRKAKPGQFKTFV